MIKRFAFALLLFASPALAQQQPDPASLQRIINALEGQRNEAMNKAALAEARAAQMTDEVQKLKADADKAKAEKPHE